jgi:hypothetical protein
MYARVTRGRFNVDTVDEVQRKIDEALVPKLKQLPGFQSYRGGFNRSTGTLIALSFWDTEEHAQALQAQRGSFEAMGVEFEPAEFYEITVQV